MQWKDHSNLRNRHAVLAPSNHSWTNYDDDKLIFRFDSEQRKSLGTDLHEWAETTILLHQRMKKLGMVPDLIQKRPKTTIQMYMNDAVKYNMRVEQPLSYDDQYCFGTADSIILDGNTLRIHDLKTGETPASMDQLIKYAALFCLEYNYDPNQLIFDLRIYQTDEIVIYKATPEEIIAMMNLIVHDCDILRRHERGEL